MGRKSRYIATNVTYHVYTRCIDKQYLLESDEFKDILIKVIEETLELYTFELNSYQIMNNHIHLIITTRNDEDTISKIMQRIKSVAARRYNKKLGRIGPFWNERFGSTIIKEESESYSYPNTILYLAYNPVRAGLVTNPNDAKYSSYNCHIRKNFKAELPITFHTGYLQLGSTHSKRVKRLLKMEQIYISQINKKCA